MRLIGLALITAVGLAATTPALAQEALAKSSGCLNCHAVDTKKMGPSFKDIAAKYKGKPDAAATITAALSGGKHPPVKASPEDLSKIVTWILSL